MQLQTYAKIGIVVGIGSLAILTPFFALSAYLQHESDFAQLFIDSDKQLQLMKAKESYKNFLDRYPDAIVEERDRRHNVELDIRAFDNITGNELRLSLGYDYWDDRIYEHANCDVNDGDFRQQLDSISDAELTIPVSFYNRGNAHDQYTAEFIKYTNCLEMDSDDELVGKVSNPEYGEIPTYTISVPQGSSVPGCEEIAHCFEPEEITIKEGQIIEWKNYDDAMHTITSGDPSDGPTGLFDSGIAEPDAIYALKFEVAGDYPYFCMVHPWQTGMITVTK